MTFVYLIFAIIIGVLIYLFTKGFSNSKYTANENEFSQAGVTVNFNEQTLSFKNKKFNVNQVTRLRMNHFESGRRGNSKAMNVIIELDDFDCPSHKIMFLSSGQGQKFMQRFSTALRKAGGPSFA
ncbi:hypothetical protein Oweho_0252 [Owenweeksia hongkongensis DSM 17368]|uniref:Uncharacterized protein n=1 Tax=Owenweeksia hongkongensis (strain DSM 17368 / CIP 108786 / JCM 12287 / NRRL B-23963 / UST20020801) TaxID=926562 RepID=G8R7G3_OWEHD|nr:MULTISPECIES: hypothetical protein [Bacteroidota]AEV31274.1 hypothetical protein Oweho_0252 [Owenweeksia hongkongensis DSM 17368]MBI0400592.1 hypothetical protein [Cyclobacterium marinum]